MKVKIYELHAFAKSIHGGNPAGVILNGNDFTEKEMQRVAQQVGFSESVFIQSSSTVDYKFKYFTPMEEIDLCGHATIAAFSLLRELKLIKSGEYQIETKVGKLKIRVMNNGMVFMNQSTPTFNEIISPQQLVGCFNIEIDDFISHLPIQIVSTGVKDIIVPIKNLEILRNLKPNFDRIKEISERYQVVGIHAFALNTNNSCFASTRNFAPLYGINEEAATGTSNGALASYLFQNKMLNGRTKEIIIEQGYELGRPSEIKVNLEIKNNQIQEVTVGGKAFLINEKDIII